MPSIHWLLCSEWVGKVHFVSKPTCLLTTLNWPRSRVERWRLISISTLIVNHTSLYPPSHLAASHWSHRWRMDSTTYRRMAMDLWCYVYCDGHCSQWVDLSRGELKSKFQSSLLTSFPNAFLSRSKSLDSFSYQKHINLGYWLSKRQNSEKRLETKS